MNRTDEDAAMQAPPEGPQWPAVRELQRKGWRYRGFDATGRRILMSRDGQLSFARVNENGTVHYV